MATRAVDQLERAGTPEIGALVRVRGEQWVVADVVGHVNGDGAGSTVVDLQSVADGRYGETLKVIWEVEPGRQVLPAGSLPQVRRGAFDKPERLAAFLDAVRWSAVTSADVKTLQAPFRAGVAVEPYQLEPVTRAVESPRVNLLLADDVGLGKTIEAGLVAQELLLRHRARRVMVVCPAGLTLKWRDEMAERFGLDFTIIDSQQCAALRRTHGSAANPFRVYPLSIVSLPWLRGPKGQRLLDEVLTGLDENETKRPFDLLILDEAHHVAPAAPKQRYAVDSQQTKLIRRMAPFFEHRLFLSATPHNGYQESFTALLELIDDHKFARGATPDPVAMKETVVRRLKRQIVNHDGSRRFVERTVSPLPVEYPHDERELHRQLAAYARLRHKRVRGSVRGRKAADLVTLLLKKRFFSSPEAFAQTVGVYLETMKRQVQAKTRGAAARHGKAVPTRHVADEVPEWLDGFFNDIAAFDDEDLHSAENDALRRSGTLQAADSAMDPSQDEQEAEALERMLEWANSFANKPDAKARKLIEYLNAICRPDGKHWSNERVVVFTEYRDTQTWLETLLRQEGLAADGRLELLHGGMNAENREEIRLAFQAAPTAPEGAVRILLATDAASEGIDLQDFCHRLVNYDIPFNPNKLEQRIGRIDRYGQRRTPEIFHFVGVGASGAQSADDYEADLEFLTRVAVKVAQMEEDLGAVNAVLAEAVQRRMLGEDVDVERETAKTRSGRRGHPKAGQATAGLAANTDVSEQVRRCTAEVEATVTELGITPQNLRRVVGTALELAHQQPLVDCVDEDSEPGELFDVPPLTGSYARATAGLIDKLTERQRPVTFDPQVAAARRDAVLAHLSHPLVSMSVRLLRAAVWNDKSIDLHRVTAVVSDDPALETTLIGAYARFLLVGADGVRLHEEVLYAGGWLRDGTRFNRLENLGTLGGILDRALTYGAYAAPHLQTRFADAWPKVQDGLVRSLDWRKDARLKSLSSALARREQDEKRRIEVSLDRFAATLRGALGEHELDDDDGQLKLWDDPKELAQARRDREEWDRKLRRLDVERERELAVIAQRYRDPQPHLFPVAVVCVIPKREAVR